MNIPALFYETETNNLRKAKSSWKTYSNERVTPSDSAMPFPSIATHRRGIFVEDRYYSANTGDLDKCNGITDAHGNYAYYYTEDYPYGPLCSFGSPDVSFFMSNNAYDNGGSN
ncbi:MAG: YHYH protein [Colwellia sp.]|nr:YHYH protein [Colwellia sp.]